MRIFLDSSDLNEIEKVYDFGILAGITTNPSSMALAKAKYDNFEKYLKLLLKFNVPISIQVPESNFQNMLDEARKLNALSSNVVIKVSMTQEGIRLVSYLHKENISVNVTLCFSLSQAILARNAGADYVSLFMGRLDDIQHHGADLIYTVSKVFKESSYFLSRKTLILAASIRSVWHFNEALKSGADIATIPYSVFKSLFYHPLTDLGNKKFMDDWKEKFKKHSYF